MGGSYLIFREDATKYLNDRKSENNGREQMIRTLQEVGVRAADAIHLYNRREEGNDPSVDGTMISSWQAFENNKVSPLGGKSAKKRGGGVTLKRKKKKKKKRNTRKSKSKKSKKLKKSKKSKK